METPEQTKVLTQLAKRIVSIRQPHPIRVAIDGIDASGKTTLANTLVPYIEVQQRPVIRASIDGFHRPRVERYRRGEVSPESYYEDSFDYEALKDNLLVPLGANGNRLYRTAIFDYLTDTSLELLQKEAPNNAILLFDGVFLLRSEVVQEWDYCIFVHVDFEVGLQRALMRDLTSLGTSEVIQTRYNQRYYPGQRLYFEIAQPQKHANVIVENNNIEYPRLTFQSDS